MDNLSKFYLELSVDSNKLESFENANYADRQLMLQEAGVSSAADVLAKKEDEIRKLMATHLIDATGAWHGLENNSGNTDNKSNIGRLGRH